MVDRGCAAADQLGCRLRRRTASHARRPTSRSRNAPPPAACPRRRRRHVERCLSQPVGRAQRSVGQIEPREPLSEAPDRRGMNTFAAADDDQHVTQIQPGQIVIRRPAHRQFEREVRRRRERAGVVGQQLHPPGRLLQKRHRTHQHCRAPEHAAGAEHAEEQAHVVVEGQPRHQSGVRRRNIAVVLEVVGHDLLDIREDVLVRDHHTGRLRESTPTCTADRPSSDTDPHSASSIRGESKSSASISITRGARCRAEHWAYGITSSTTADVVSITAGEQSRSAPDTRSSCPPNCGTESGTAMNPACIAPKKADDVIQALRSQYRCPITDRPAPQKLLGDNCALW